MSYLGVRTMVKHLKGRPVEKRIDTGVSLVTLENMEKPDIHELLHPPVGQYLKDS
jgi:ribose transport system substrate-binding protein